MNSRYRWGVINTVNEENDDGEGGDASVRFQFAFYDLWPHSVYYNWESSVTWQTTEQTESYFSQWILNVDTKLVGPTPDSILNAFDRIIEKCVRKSHTADTSEVKGNQPFTASRLLTLRVASLARIVGLRKLGIIHELFASVFVEIINSRIRVNRLFPSQCNIPTLSLG